MGLLGRFAAVVVVPLSVAGGCGKSGEDLGIVRSTPGDAGSERSAHGGLRDAGTVPSDAHASPRADTELPTTDARASHDATMRNVLDASNFADAVLDASATSQCAGIEQALVEERRRAAGCAQDTDCTVLFDDLCGSSGHLFGRLGCFLPTNASSDPTARKSLEQRFVTECGGQPVACDCNGPPPAACASGTCVVAEACAISVSSTIPGVRIEFPSQPCTFTLAEAAAGIDLHYRLIVDQPILDLQIPAEPCSCLGPLREAVSGGGQWYCECDFGCCDQPAGEIYPLASGVTDSTFSWNGRNWNGPSDTGEPVGAPFPPGTYGFEVTLSLLRAGDARILPLSATGILTVTLVP